jgi:tight adherence protein C
MVDLGPIAFGVTIFCGAAFIGSFFISRTSRATMRRIGEVTNHGVRYRRSAPLVRDTTRRVFAAMHWVRTRLGLAEDLTLPERLSRAGFKGVVPVDTFVASRILGPLAGLIAGSFIPSNRLFWMVAFGGLAYLAPDIVLTRLVLRRRENIRLSIPDAIDLLVICVDAGLGIDQALLRVGQELGNSHPEITQELLQINREQRAGKTRLQAWTDMALRSGLPDIDAFANMLMQTERFGTPIARALSTFAETLRSKRRQLAEELAAKTTVKIIFPLVLFIFPSMFIVLLGPATLNIMRGMSSMGK